MSSVMRRTRPFAIDRVLLPARGALEDAERADEEAADAKRQRRPLRPVATAGPRGRSAAPPVAKAFPPPSRPARALATMKNIALPELGDISNQQRTPDRQPNRQHSGCRTSAPVEA